MAVVLGIAALLAATGFGINRLVTSGGGSDPAGSGEQRLGTLGLGSSTSSSPPTRTGTVVMVGDSVLAMSRRAIRARTQDDLDVVIDGQTGERSDELLDELVDAVRRRPEAVVWLAGNNDNMQRTDWREPLRDVLDATSDVPCVVLVGLTEYGGPIFDNFEAQRYNRELARVASADTRVHLVDWKAVLDRYIDHGGLSLTADTIHPNPLGQTAMAEAIDTALAGCGVGHA